MNLYRLQETKFLTPLVLRNKDTREESIRYVDPVFLCFNKSWTKIFFPQQEIDSFIFEYKGDISLIIRMLDILHGETVDTTLQEDIELAFLLREHGEHSTYKYWLSQTKISLEEDTQRPTQKNYADWVKEHVHVSRWLEAGIKLPCFQNNIIITSRYFDYSPEEREEMENTPTVYHILNADTITKEEKESLSLHHSADEEREWSTSIYSGIPFDQLLSYVGPKDIIVKHNSLKEYLANDALSYRE